MKPRKLTSEELEELEESRREREKEREDARDLYLESSDPSQEAVKGFLWFP